MKYNDSPVLMVVLAQSPGTVKLMMRLSATAAVNPEVPSVSPATAVQMVPFQYSTAMVPPTPAVPFA